MLELKSPSPLCANCHRMTHRKKYEILEVNDLIENIKNNGVFNK